MCKDQPVIEFTPAKVKHLRNRYNDAMAKGETRIIFDDHVMLTTFVYYLLEYLELRFSGNDG